MQLAALARNGRRLLGLSLAGILLLLGEGQAGAEWEQVTIDQGVEVFEQPVAGRGLPMFRGLTEIDGSLEEILSVVSDVPSHPSWMPDCAESRVVRDEGEVVVVYRRTEAPWPVSDRDVVVESRTQVIEPDVEVHVYFRSVDEPSVEPASGAPASGSGSGAVRMPYLVGHYKLRALGPGRTRVEYQVDADPGGRLPGWLAAGTSRGNPVRTLVGLQSQIRARRPPPVAAGAP